MKATRDSEGAKGKRGEKRRGLLHRKSRNLPVVAEKSQGK